MGNSLSPHTTSIHVLNNDSLLNIFDLYHPLFLDELAYDLVYVQAGLWGRGRWWYELVHICQRWRNLILGSASYLRLSLVCTNGVPVANMLAHSPSLPLTVEYISNNDITAEDEEGIMLALGHQDHVRELCIVFPVWNLQKLFVAIDEEFPILEYLILVPSVFESTVLMLPETLQPPRLRHLILMGFAYPIQPRLHPTAVGLVTLFLTIIHPSAYFHPSVLLQWISFMPHLETLAVYFSFFIPDLDMEGAERQLTHMPITTPITLPNLRMLALNCISTYLEVFICQITTPRLEHLIIQFFKQLTFSIPHLMQFLNTTEGLRFDSVELEFSDK